jgi:hypothetical protein
MLQQCRRTVNLQESETTQTLFLARAESVTAIEDNNIVHNVLFDSILSSVPCKAIQFPIVHLQLIKV